MEDYKEKYEMALERAKKNYDAAQDLCNGSQIGVECFKNTLTNIFPELKESEDERIRRNIIAALKGEGYYDCDLTNECIAWLEKQESVGEIVERCKNSWYNEGKIAGMAEGLTNDEKYQQGWHDALEKQGEQKPFNYENATIAQKDFACGAEVATGDGSIKTVVSKWSEKDEEMCQETIDWFEKKCFPYALEYENPARESIQWLKSLKGRVQPKPKEWSEEDEEMADELIKGFLSSESPYQLTHTCKEIADWLKSIKDRIKGKEDKQ